MGRFVNACDNAKAERFMRTLKVQRGRRCCPVVCRQMATRPTVAKTS
jgi:hypothetical protein